MLVYILYYNFIYGKARARELYVTSDGFADEKLGQSALHSGIAIAYTYPPGVSMP